MSERDEEEEDMEKMDSKMRFSDEEDGCKLGI